MLIKPPNMGSPRVMAWVDTPLGHLLSILPSVSLSLHFCLPVFFGSVSLFPEVSGHSATWGEGPGRGLLPGSVLWVPVSPGLWVSRSPSIFASEHIRGLPCLSPPGPVSQVSLSLALSMCEWGRYAAGFLRV